jgi:hypothetical protein
VQTPAGQQQQQCSIPPGVTQLHSVLPLLHCPPGTELSSYSSSSGASGGSLGAAASWYWAVPGTASPASLAAVYHVLVSSSPGLAVAQRLLPTHYHQWETTVTSDSVSAEPSSGGSLLTPVSEGCTLLNSARMLLVWRITFGAHACMIRTVHEIQPTYYVSSHMRL